jgi:exopolysaccharide production protein ExoQ
MKLVLEQAFTILALLLYSGAVGCFIGDNNPLIPLRDTMAVTGFLITCYLIQSNWQQILPVAGRDKFVWLLVGLALLSVFWSDYPVESFNEAAPLFRVTVFGLYFASRYTIHGQLRMLALSICLGALMSLVVSLFVPYYGVMGAGLITNMEQNQHAGVWRGVYIHKVVLGAVMTLGVLVCTYCYSQATERLYRWGMLGGIFLCFAMLIMSTTKTALIGLFLVFALIPFFKMLKNKSSLARSVTTLIILIVISVITLVIFNFENAVALIGREVSFSGRTDYWGPLLEKLWERPWFGYGYRAFWQGGWKGEPYYVWRLLADGNEPPHAHNGLLSIALDVGIVGTGLFLLSYCKALARSLKWLHDCQTDEALVPICFLLIFAILNFTESMSMMPELPWIYYVSIAFSVCEPVRKHLPPMGMTTTSTHLYPQN